MINHPNRKKAKAAKPAKSTTSEPTKLDIHKFDLAGKFLAVEELEAALHECALPIVRLGMAFEKLVHENHFEPLVSLYIAVSHIESVRRATSSKGRTKPGDFTRMLEAMQNIVEQRWDSTEERVAAAGGDPHAVAEPNKPEETDNFDNVDDRFAALSDLPGENYFSVENPQGISPKTMQKLDKAVSAFLRKTGEFGDERFVVKSVDYQGFTGEMTLMVDEV